MIAVTGNAVLIVDLVAEREMGRHVPSLPQRIIEPHQRDRLAAECDLRRRRWMDGPHIRRCRDARSYLAVRDAADDQGDRRQHSRANDFQPRLHEHLVHRLLELSPARFVVADPDQHADKYRRHVLEYDATRHHRTARQRRDNENDDEIGEYEHPDGLPEWVAEIDLHL